MAEDKPKSQRVRVDGKFFRLGESKFHLKGVTYGPFKPNADGDPVPSRKQAGRDFDQIIELGANTLRVYHVPPKWLLDAAEAKGLKLLIDVPWWKTGCFLDSRDMRRQAREAVRNAAEKCKGHPAVLAFSVVNEIAPDVVRWHGAKLVSEFIDSLAAIARAVDPGCLVTFGNFPPTEYLAPREIDFVCFNVYLHEQKPFEGYLARLQSLANEKPLVLGEIGYDSRGEPGQSIDLGDGEGIDEFEREDVARRIDEGPDSSVKEPLQFGMEKIELDGLEIESTAIHQVPASIVEKFNIVPIFYGDDILTVAISNPSDLDLMDSLRHLIKVESIEFRVAAPEQIARLIAKYYPKIESESLPRIQAKALVGGGETDKCEMLEWQIESAFRGGLAGICIFSFTDDWHKDGKQVEGWEFGLVDKGRRVKPSYWSVKKSFAAAPYFTLPRTPKVSVVVATYNGAATLKETLRSLEKLNYPDFEVMVVDDGSTDKTGEVARSFESVRYVHQENLGLSVARNTGIATAKGEVIAFTDDDCRVDEDWLHFLVSDLLRNEFQGIGGHNFLPPEDSPTAAVVMASPGGPAHVMLTDREAEHIPGCNMAFYKSVLDDVGGFDPIYRKAGDDVDLCWRLQQASHRIGFSHAGFVWHYRRSTAVAYLKQQYGYGEAEALLIRKHPEYFNALGGGRWRGRIYGAANWSAFGQPIIYRGRYAEGLFQSIYSGGDTGWVALLTSLEWHTLVTLPLLVLGYAFNTSVFAVPGIISLMVWVGLCIFAGWKGEIPRRQCRFWSRPLTAMLHFLQPLVRGWARHTERFAGAQKALSKRESLDALALKKSKDSFEQVAYWSEEPLNRSRLIEAILNRLRKDNWPRRKGSGWNDFDLEVFGSYWCRCHLITVAEWHERGREMLRVRLRICWSLLTRLCLVAGIAVALIGSRAMEGNDLWWLIPWAIPFCVLAAPMLEGESLRRILSVLLDQAAGDLKLKKVERSVNVAPAPTPVDKSVKPESTKPKSDV